jgi:hypothetical protein
MASAASAVRNPLPSAPISRPAGITQLSKYSSLVGEPLMPSLCSSGPNENPASPFSTTNAEIPAVPAAGSVTAMTV